MFSFKKKVAVSEYCNAKFNHLFSKERETIWLKLIEECNDPALKSTNKIYYFNNMKAIYLQLLGIGVTKNSSLDAGSDFHSDWNHYSKANNLMEIDRLYSQYNQAFASSYVDGIKEMTAFFFNNLTDSEVSPETFELFYSGFYGVLSKIFLEFKKIKLTAK